MGRKEENQDFECIECKKQVSRLKAGSYRNHCPFCLYSLHLDKDVPGDRKSSCHGVMKPMGVRFHTKKGWQIEHKCTACNVIKVNKIVEYDVQSDDWKRLVELNNTNFHQ